MKNSVVLLLLAFHFISASGQTDKGYEFLGRSEFSQAENAFKADLAHPLYGIAAKVGLGECYQKENASLTRMSEGLYLVREAREQFSGLDAKAKAELTRFKVSAGKFSNLEKSIQQTALQYVKTSQSVLDLDTLLTHFLPLDKGVEKEIEAAKLQLVQGALENATDYATIRSLVNNHYIMVAKLNFRYSRDLQSRLLTAFYRNVGYPNLAKFIADNPNHTLSLDCWAKEFGEAVKDRSGWGLIRFLIDYPKSTLDNLASAILKLITESGAFVPGLESYSPQEKALLELLKEEWQIKAVIQGSESLSGDFPDRFYTFIQQAAPASRSYYLMQDVLQKYLTERKWDAATFLIKKTRALYPDGQPEGCETRFGFYLSKQAWFKVATPIVEKEAENIFRRPVTPVNTPDGDEFSPGISADGLSLYFGAAGRMENIGGEDIFVSHYDLKAKSWTAPTLVAELSSPGNESPLSLTSDGNRMLLFRDGLLCLSRLEKNGWSQPVPLPDNINKFAWVGRAALSSKGNVMVFEASRDIQEVFGSSNIDLYFSMQDGSGNWSAPQPLGPDVNTLEDERSPFLFHDDKTLYFSSNGHKGLGQMDIYFSKRLDDTWLNWSIPQNLGKEINTLEDDWGYNYAMTPRENAVYLASEDIFTQLGDIYYTQLPGIAQPEAIVPLSGFIQVGETPGANNKILVTDAETGEILDEVQPRPDGSFTLLLPPGERKITYHIQNKDYFPVSRTIDLANKDKIPFTVDTLRTVLLTDMLAKGKTAPLNSILFDFDEAILKPQSFPELSRVVEMMNNQPWQIVVEGHTDNAGTAEYNKNLSLKRAQSVKNYLENRGIPARKITVKGFGAEVPVADNATEAGQEKNRRVEIRFVVVK